MSLPACQWTGLSGMERPGPAQPVLHLGHALDQRDMGSEAKLTSRFAAIIGGAHKEAADRGAGDESRAASEASPAFGEIG